MSAHATTARSKGIEVSSPERSDRDSVSDGVLVPSAELLPSTLSRERFRATSKPATYSVRSEDTRRAVGPKDFEKKHPYVSLPPNVSTNKLDSIRRRMKIVKMGKGAKTSLRAELRMLYGIAVAVNFNAAKYVQTLGGSVNLSWAAIVQAVDGFANLESLFNEFFVRSITMEFVPNNKYSSNSSASGNAAGSPGDINTCGGTIYFVPHHQAAYADSATAWYQAREVKYSKYVNLGDKFKFVAKNDEKFAWDGPLGDMTTATSTMQWLTFPQVAALGGLFGLICPLDSGAAAGIGVLLENGIFGYAVLSVDLALRARI